MVRCRSLKKFWKNYLSPYNVSNEVTFINDDKHACVFLHVGLPPWISSSDTLLSMDIDSGLAKLCELPFEVSSFGWWDVIASHYGLVCISDRFSVVYISKEHPTDDFLYYDIYDSAHSEWVHGRSYLVRMHKLGYHNVIYQGRAYWIDWSGPEYNFADLIVSFDIHEQKFMLLPKKSRDKLNYLIDYDETLCFASHQIRFSGVTLVFWKIEMEVGHIVEWKRFTRLCNLGIKWNPIMLSGHDLIRVKEDHAYNDNGELTQTSHFSISKYNTKQGSLETFFIH
ncbi:hypothetical protein PIB30_084597 [Stylosanthes scabra]|uniref:F-box associated domain-containing protein n=1 Tax=Stylosanthes scabra TaxID=79078 RepID=A0ABU6RT70_9FABA|nr:hypothetical protein [Stylosanthes scabra]